MKQIKKEQINKVLEDNIKGNTILVVKRKPKLNVSKNGNNVELNEGYEYDVNSSIPEIADSIAKFAKELPHQGMGVGSDKYFLDLINQYFGKL